MTTVALSPGATVSRPPKSCRPGPDASSAICGRPVCWWAGAYAPFPGSPSA